jgi:hypothetical protein
MMPSRVTNFCSTVVKPYKREFNNYIINNDKNSSSNIDPLVNITSPIDTADDPDVDSDYNEEVDDFLPRFQPPSIKQGRGRPKGSKNRPKNIITTIFIISKKKFDLDLIYQLRTAGKITISGKLFEVSDKTEIDSLIANSVFRFEQFDANKYQGRIFDARFVRKIKGKNTDALYEKSRLVIRGFDNDDK